MESCSTSSTSFLAELPSRNKANFAHCQPNDSRRKQAPKTYIPLNDTSPPPDQVIHTDKTNILLRYLTKQAEVTRSGGSEKHASTGKEPLKRPGSPDEDEEHPADKLARTE